MGFSSFRGGVGEDTTYRLLRQPCAKATLSPMPCFIGCLAMGFPRLAIVLVVIFSDYIGTACQTLLWPLLGFFFMPLTTLAYAWAWHHGNSQIFGIGLMVVILAALMDLGIIGSGAHNKKTRVYYQRMTAWPSSGEQPRPRKRV